MKNYFKIVFVRILSLWVLWDCEPKCYVDCCLRSIFELEIRSSIVWVAEKFKEFWVSCKTSSEGTRMEVGVAVWLRRQKMVENLCFFLWGLSVKEFVRHPVPVEEVESVSMHKLRGYSLYTLQEFDWDEDLSYKGENKK